jgi:hypothetical protein
MKKTFARVSIGLAALAVFKIALEEIAPAFRVQFTDNHTTVLDGLDWLLDRWLPEPCYLIGIAALSILLWIAVSLQKPQS